MSKRANTNLSPTEWMVMRAVWELTAVESVVTVSEVLPLVTSQRSWHFSTLKTTMDRLVKKGALSSRIRGKTCFYKPEVTQEGVARRSIATYLDTVLDGAFGPLVAYLAERKQLSKKEIDDLDRMLNEKREEKER